jgi:hypothetical protein
MDNGYKKYIDFLLDKSLNFNVWLILSICLFIASIPVGGTIHYCLVVWDFGTGAIIAIPFLLINIWFFRQFFFFLSEKYSQHLNSANNYFLSKKGMSLFQWIFLIILLSLASFFILGLTHLVLFVPIVLVNIWFYNQFYIYLNNTDINPNSEKLKNYLLNNSRMNSSLWIVFSIILTGFSIFFLIFPPFVFIIPIFLLNKWFYTQYNIYRKNKSIDTKEETELDEVNGDNNITQFSDNSEESIIIPDVCQHCKSPNTKKIRICEWCGHQII